MTSPPSSPAGETLAGLVAGVAGRTRETFRRPLVPPGVSPRRLWIWATLLAVAWHLFWWVWLRADPRPRFHPAPVGVRLAYLPVTPPAPGDTGGAAGGRSVWSPVLFSLPTEQGFSRPVLRRELALAPPIETPGEGALFLEQAPAHAPAPVAVDEEWLRQLEAARRERSQGLARPGEFDQVAVELPRGALQLDVLNGLEGMPASRSLPIPADGQLPAAKPWEAVAWIQVNELGRVGHAFLEQPSPSQRWNSLLVRALYQLPADPAMAGAKGRLRIRFPGQAGMVAGEEGP